MFKYPRHSSSMRWIITLASVCLSITVTEAATGQHTRSESKGNSSNMFLFHYQTDFIEFAGETTLRPEALLLLLQKTL